MPMPMVEQQIGVLVLSNRGRLFLPSLRDALAVSVVASGIRDAIQAGEITLRFDDNHY